MLGSKVHSVVPDFAVLRHVPVVRGEVNVLGLIGVYRVAEAFVNGDEARTGLIGRGFGRSGIVAR